MDLTQIILALLALLGNCGWLIDHRRHRAQLQILHTEHQQKQLSLSEQYTAAFKQYITDPLTTHVTTLENRVNHLTQTINTLNHALQQIPRCPMAADCPVHHELQKHPPHPPA